MGGAAGQGLAERSLHASLERVEGSGEVLKCQTACSPRGGMEPGTPRGAAPRGIAYCRETPVMRIGVEGTSGNGPLVPVSVFSI